MVAPSLFFAAHFRATAAFPTQTRHLKPTDSTKQYGNPWSSSLFHCIQQQQKDFRNTELNNEFWTYRNRNA